MKRSTQRAWLAWAAVSVLAFLCGSLAILQYRWIGEISAAERRRLQEDIDNRLDLLRRSFNETILAACSALQPGAGETGRLGKEAAYESSYGQWKRPDRPLFRRLALAEIGDGPPALHTFDLESGRLAHSEWPPEWSAVRQALMEGPPRPAAGLPYGLLLASQFGPPQMGMPRGRDWLILELNTEYIRNSLLPELIDRFLGKTRKLDYAIEVAVSSDPPVVIYQSEPDASRKIGRAPDASAPLLEGDPGFARDGRGGPPSAAGPAFPGRSRGPAPPGFRRGPRGPGFNGRGGPPFGPEAPPRPAMRVQTVSRPWIVEVRHKAGSLEALVTQARRRNLGLSAGMLLLILTTAAVLVRASRQAQRLAELQMNFVAGVSHELRTPLTVIRTAAFNLRGKLAQRPDQVERYGQLIQGESERLSALVEQVLRFAAASAGQLARNREPVAVEALVERSLEAHREALEKSGVAVEKRIDPDLPPVLANELALRHALQNLIDNALKYGSPAAPWIGIFASAVGEKDGRAVEIRVADRGPGVPPGEQKAIFDPFFRGRRAVEDQIHGAGLGLDLVKKIVEAHGGSVRVESAPGKGSAFILRVPAA